MNIPDLAQQAIQHLRPELLLLAAKTAEGAATESGKQVVTWFRDRLKGKAAESALDDAAAHPEDNRRLQALQLQIEILAEENESFRRDLLALVAHHPKTEITNQTATAIGNNNPIAQASGKDINIKIG